jgi:hypothetical protein
LTKHLPPQGSSIQASQEASPLKPALTGSPKITFNTTRGLPLSHQLEQLKVSNSPKGCNEAVLVQNVLDGATVSITRASDDSVDTSVFDATSLWLAD